MPNIYDNITDGTRLGLPLRDSLSDSDTVDVATGYIDARLVQYGRHRIVIVRMRLDERTKTYVAKRTAEGKTKSEIIRCLKRHLIREIWRNTRHLQQQSPTAPTAAKPAA